MSTTTTTTTRDRGDRYGPIEWAQLLRSSNYKASSFTLLARFIALLSLLLLAENQQTVL